MEINRLHTITAEVVDAARETLVLGQPLTRHRADTKQSRFAANYR
jgi:hypothetical protein